MPTRVGLLNAFHCQWPRGTFGCIAASYLAYTSNPYV